MIPAAVLAIAWVAFNQQTDFFIAVMVKLANTNTKWNTNTNEWGGDYTSYSIRFPLLLPIITRVAFDQQTDCQQKYFCTRPPHFHQKNQPVGKLNFLISDNIVTIIVVYWLHAEIKYETWNMKKCQIRLVTNPCWPFWNKSIQKYPLAEKTMGDCGRQNKSRF